MYFLALKACYSFKVGKRKSENFNDKVVEVKTVNFSIIHKNCTITRNFRKTRWIENEQGFGWSCGCDRPIKKRIL